MGYLGMVGGRNPCADLVSVPYLLAQTNQSFEDSPYGFTYGQVDPVTDPYTLTPYLVDAATLEIEYRPDLAITSDVIGEIFLDDSTMISGLGGSFIGTNPFQHRDHSLYAITRSGLTLTVSGPQQTVTENTNTGAIAWLCRIDDTHFTRSYVPYDAVLGHTGSAVVQTFSVSGGTITLDLNEVLGTAAIIVSRDPGGGTAAMSNLRFLPFHYDGSGTLLIHTTSQRLTAPFSTHFVVAAVPYTVGGGVGTIDTSTRVNDDHEDLISAQRVYAAKIGTSECVVIHASGGSRVAMYDDGSNMHFGGFGPNFSHINHHGGSGLMQTPQGNYLATGVYDPVTDPTGSLVVNNAVMLQSGTSLTYEEIFPFYLCSSGDVGGCRHGPNLGAKVGGHPTVFAENTVYAYRW